MCNKVIVQGRGTHVVHQHALDATLQRDGTRVTGSAGAAQLQLDKAVVKAPKLNVAAILLDGGADPRLEQLLDHAHHLVVVLVVGEAVLLHAGGGGLLGRRRLPGGDEGLAARNRLGDEGKDLGPDVRPVCVAGLCDGDEVGAVKHRRHAVNVHQLGGQLRRVRRGYRRARVQVLDKGRREALGEHAVVGQELERVGVGRRFGLDEDGAPARAGRAEAGMLLRL